MTEKILSLSVSSPQELREKLAGLGSAKKSYQFISLSFSNKNALVYPFHIPEADKNNLEARLMKEAAGLLSLKGDLIEFDFQIFDTKEGMMEGIFLCMPKKLLTQYLDTCDKARLIPIHFTSDILVTIGRMFSHHAQEKERLCAIDFRGEGQINLALFCDGKCEFLRQIRFESQEEAKSDIQQSIRSACAKSQNKSIEKIYASGEFSPFKTLIEQIGQASNSTIYLDESAQPSDNFDFTKNYFKVNLTRYYTFAIERRKKFILISNIILGVLLLLFALSLLRLILTQAKVSKIKSSYTSADLARARELKEKVDNAK